MMVNEVLRNTGQIDQAYNHLCRLGLSGLDKHPKCWDLWKAAAFIRARGSIKSPVLDAGTSTCRLLEVLRCGGFSRLYGCDLAAVEWRRLVMPYLRPFKPVRLAKSLLGRGPIILSRQDIRHTRYPDKHFDFVVSLSVIEHGIEADAYFSEMRRLVRPGGYLTISADYWPEPVDTSHLRPYGMPWRVFDRAGIECAVSAAGRFGFELIQPIDFSAGEPLIEWGGRRYSFIFFVLRKAP